MNPQINYHENGQKHTEEWYINGCYHRIDGPAYQSWHYNGLKYCEIWKINRMYHRIDGPAYQIWFDNGQKHIEEWVINGIDKTIEIKKWLKINKIRLYKGKIPNKHLMLFKLKWSC